MQRLGNRLRSLDDVRYVRVTCLPKRGRDTNAHGIALLQKLEISGGMQFLCCHQGFKARARYIFDIGFASIEAIYFALVNIKANYFVASLRKDYC